MKTAIIAAAGIAVAASAQTIDLTWTIINGSTFEVVADPTAPQAAGPYYAVLTASFSAFANELTTDNASHDFGLIGFVGGIATTTHGFSAAPNFAQGADFAGFGGLPAVGATGAIVPNGDVTAVPPVGRWLVAGANVLVWDARQSFDAVIAAFQIEHDGNYTELATDFNVEFGLFAGSKNPITGRITVNTNSGTAFNQGDVTVNNPLATIGVPAPAAAGAFAVAGLAAARRRR